MSQLQFSHLQVGTVTMQFLQRMIARLKVEIIMETVCYFSLYGSSLPFSSCTSETCLDKLHIHYPIPPQVPLAPDWVGNGQKKKVLVTAVFLWLPSSQVT